MEGSTVFSHKEMDRLIEALAMPSSDGYVTYPEEGLNRLCAYCRALDEYEEQILRLTGAELRTILMSKYYWRSRLETLYERLHGSDRSLSQYTYKAVEELDQRVEDLDWAVLERLDQEIREERQKAGETV